MAVLPTKILIEVETRPARYQGEQVVWHKFYEDQNFNQCALVCRLDGQMISVPALEIRFLDMMEELPHE